MNSNFRSLHTSSVEPIATSKDLSPKHLAPNRPLTQGQKRAWSGPVWSCVAWTGLDWKEEGAGNTENGSCLQNNDVQNIHGSAHSDHTLSISLEYLISIQEGTSSGMPWRIWGHRNRSCGVNEVNHADPTLSPLHLTCYSFQLELNFYSSRWLHWYTSWLSLNAHATAGAPCQRTRTQTKLLHICPL